MARASSIAVIASFVGGSLIALQSRLNGQLSSTLHNPPQAAVFSLVSGLLILCVLVLVIASIRSGLRRIRATVRGGQLEWWALTAGILGGCSVIVQTATVPLLGVSVFTIALVSGQSASSLFVDRVGLGPTGKQAVTLRRAIAAVLTIVAVILAVSDRFGSATFPMWAVAFALAAGLVLSVQQALNGQVSRAAQNPMAATFVNFLLGSVLAITAFVVVWMFSGIDPAPWPRGPWWIYLGGGVGVCIVGIMSWVVPVIGVLIFALSSIAGQLIGALVLDAVAPTGVADITWNLISGITLAFVAVFIAASGRRSDRPARR